MPESISQQTRQAELNNMLVKAATEGNVLDIEACLELGADIHARDELALREAALNYQKEAVRYLCDHGADFAVALCNAASVGDLHVTQRLIGLTGTDQRVTRTLRAAFRNTTSRKSRSTGKARKTPKPHTSERFIW